MANEEKELFEFVNNPKYREGAFCLCVDLSDSIKIIYVCTLPQELIK